MRLLILIFFISTKLIVGQITGTVYYVTIGVHAFTPFVIYDSKSSKDKFVAGRDSFLNELIVHYPKRPATSLDTTKDKPKNIGDRYIIDFFIDSIVAHHAYYIDTLLNAHIDIEHYTNNDIKKCKVYSIKAELLFSDGSTIPIYNKSDKLSKDKKCVDALNKNRRDFYFIINEIKFYNEKNRKLRIKGKYGWKFKMEP